MAGGHRRRPRLDGAARDRQAGPDRAGHEPAHVGAHGDAAQSRAARRRRRRDRRPERAARWPSAARPASAAWPSRWRSPPPPRRCCAQPAAEPLAGRRVLVTSGPDARADRSGALHRQPLVRQAGPRHRRAPRPTRAPTVTLVSGSGAHCPIRPASTVVHVETRARDAGGGRGRRCRPMSPSSPPRSPTGASRSASAREDQEGRRRHADARAGRESRHPRHRRAPQAGRPPPGHRLCGRDRAASIEHAKAKLARKGCDWIVANDVSAGDRRHGRRPQHRPSRHRRRRRDPGRRSRRTRSRARSIARIAAALAGATR